METKEQIKYWLKSAEHDLSAAETLYENQRFAWCLFLGHLVVEKTLKRFTSVTILTTTHLSSTTLPDSPSARNYR